MRESGADEADVKNASELLDVINIFNMGDTAASRNAAIESILRIKSRLEENRNE